MERRRPKGSADGVFVVTPFESSSSSVAASAAASRNNDHRLRPKALPRPGRIVLLISLLLLLVAYRTTTRNPPSWKSYDISTNTRPGINLRTASDACSGYRGILHIAQGDAEGAAGTVFFLFVLNQLLYAQEHNLIPWIHLNNVSHHIFDARVHGSYAQSESARTIVVSDTVQPSWLGFRDPIAQKNFGFPGPPPKETSPDGPRTVTVEGNGVWESYFLPVSDYSPTDPSCQQLPLVKLSYAQIIPGLHLNCPWSLRAWRYGGLPPALRNDTAASYSDWFRPMRQRGSRMVQKYIRFQPYMLQKAQHANPSSHCLAIHVRHSDKANRRQKIPLKRFYPYMDAYLEQVPLGGKIYVATDSSRVLEELQSLPHYHDRLLWQEGAARSQNSTAVFRQHNHHDTNVQVLVDILAMSQCQFLLHGLSAVSEAVLYLNPALQADYRGVNLELPKPTRVVSDFSSAVQEEYKSSSRQTKS